MPVPKRKKIEEVVKETVPAKEVNFLAAGDRMPALTARKSMIPIKAAKSPTAKTAPPLSTNGHARKASMIPVKSPTTATTMTSKGSMSPLASPLSTHCDECGESNGQQV